MRRGKLITLRGGCDIDFPEKEVLLKDIRGVGSIAWQKWGPMAADTPIRDLVALAYAEGLYHGMMLAPRVGVSMTGSSPSGGSPPADSASSSETKPTSTLSVKDLLESL